LEISFEDATKYGGKRRKNLRDADPHFSHLFKELKTEYLVDGDDGNFALM
jgi:hypothetical protein